ncbi:HAMP domain-containing histidine kinase [Sulfobacillus thermosulfidooxidans]|uniref:HAMP domain-containing histidine kinase n=1 Tax=Sulfobacillus thermosulfidooxidans TaxID=28034 RepID=UPI0012DF5FFD|nr:HAMP domain-containing histidine kinase [Sulfobacillus thermosulfidooxidans]
MGRGWGQIGCRGRPGTENPHSSVHGWGKFFMSLCESRAPQRFQDSANASSRNIVQLAVCDTGIGIVGSVQQSQNNIRPDTVALKLALQQGWSSKKGINGQGNGLYLIQQIVRANGEKGRLVIISGCGVAQVTERGTDFISIPNSWPGTSISLTLDLQREVNMKEIVGHPDFLEDDLWEVDGVWDQ